MLFDSYVKNVINSAYESKTDVFLRMNPPRYEELFFDNIKTAVFLPGGFLGGESSSFYDIRRLAEEEFRRHLTESRVKRLAVLFSECADKSEYGYREAFGWIGEMRAETTSRFQIVAILSPGSDSFDSLIRLFDSKDYVCLGERELPDFNVFRALSQKAKFYQTAQLVEKYAFKKSAVYFNSREEAHSFAAFLRSRGTRYSYFDGAASPELQKDDIIKFVSGETNILVATKSYISTAYFYPPEKVFFCGVPFSPSQLDRCGCFLEKEKPFVVYCEEDIKRNEKIIASFAERLSDGEISEMRINRLYDMVKMLNIKES